MFDARSGKTAAKGINAMAGDVKTESDRRQWLSGVLHKYADRSAKFAKCYFIGGEEGPVKIGYAVCVKDRLRAIQSCSPVALRVLALADGGMEREVAYHAQFERHRLHGEWFERCAEIEAEINRLNAKGATDA